jgi:hypothetical protein
MGSVDTRRIYSPFNSNKVNESLLTTFETTFAWIKGKGVSFKQKHRALKKNKNINIDER